MFNIINVQNIDTVINNNLTKRNILGLIVL